ncbi:MAG: alpha-amylase [Lachnospiraceae bacterium]|nr:alpha-amylase [Lachnospiraceae bacterium]
MKTTTIRRGEMKSEHPCNDGWQFTCIADCKSLLLHIYDADLKEIEQIDMTPYRVSGQVYSVKIAGLNMHNKCYRFEADGRFISDGYERGIFPFREWNRKAEKEELYFRPVETDMDQDIFPRIPQQDVIAYQLHVRGFTKHASAKVKHAGTFLGITEKIRHFQNLGVNQIILMPAYEFDEIDEKTGKLNYWGFSNNARYFIPKAAFSDENPEEEFAELVRKLHAKGIELIMQFYFPPRTNAFLIGECLSYWHQAYHVDGFWLIGEQIPESYLITNPLLTDAKLYFEQAEVLNDASNIVNRNVVLTNTGFLKDIRRYLKSDADTLQPFTYQMRNHPKPMYALNYISNFNEFSLRDLVSYDFKHNEENNELNRDGNSNNYSWNCGEEGPSKKQGIVKLRRQQMCNALAMLLLAQGTPMILSGDEWGQTRYGNNNPYCQDNEISWLNWKYDRTGKAVLDFIKQLIEFRKAHPILHMKEPVRLMDYRACSYPDLSYHGDQAWYPQFQENVRHIGMLYCGKYARTADRKEDASLYLAFNMHWEDKTFGLPALPKGRKWQCVIDPAGQAQETYEERFTIRGRSFIVLMG